MSNAEKQALAISLSGKLIFDSIGLIAGKVFNTHLFIKLNGFLKTLIPNYYGNIISGEINNFGMVII